MSDYQKIIDEAAKLKEISEKLTKESQQPVADRAKQYEQKMRDVSVKVHVGGSAKSNN
jgi:hypothetical protein